MIGLLIAAAPASEARAVDVCKLQFHKALGQGASRSAAQNQAKSNWETEVKAKFGSIWWIWGLACDRTLTCHEVGAGHRCTARARPGRI